MIENIKNKSSLLYLEGYQCGWLNGGRESRNEPNWLEGFDDGLEDMKNFVRDNQETTDFEWYTYYRQRAEEISEEIDLYNED